MATVVLILGIIYLAIISPGFRLVMFAVIGLVAILIVFGIHNNGSNNPCGPTVSRAACEALDRLGARPD